MTKRVTFNYIGTGGYKVNGLPLKSLKICLNTKACFLWAPLTFRDDMPIFGYGRDLHTCKTLPASILPKPVFKDRQSTPEDSNV